MRSGGAIHVCSHNFPPLPCFSLVGKGKTAKTVKRIQKYNRLITKEYGYSGAHAAVGTPAFGTANRKFPGFLHMVSPQTDNKAPTLVADVGCYCPRELDESKGEVRDIMVDYLIALDALTADLDDIRKGVCFAQQCSGMGMSNYSHSVEKEVRDCASRLFRSLSRRLDILCGLSSLL